LVLQKKLFVTEREW